MTRLGRRETRRVRRNTPEASPRAAAQWQGRRLLAHVVETLEKTSFEGQKGEEEEGSVASPVITKQIKPQCTINGFHNEIDSEQFIRVEDMMSRPLQPLSL
jgi:hypothetical protein